MDVFVMGEIRFGLLANPFVPITKRVDGKRCNLAHFFFNNVKNCGDKRKLLEIILLREQDGFFYFRSANGNPVAARARAEAWNRVSRPLAPGSPHTAQGR
jgi:hypothetical protein